MSVREDLPRRIEGVHMWRGTIAETAKNLGQLIHVIIPAFDAHSLWGPCRWMPRVYPEVVDVSEGVENEHNIKIPKVMMPTKGDECLVLLDNAKDAWVVCWWPY